jgi:hypothetical protein
VILPYADEGFVSSNFSLLLDPLGLRVTEVAVALLTAPMITPEALVPLRLMHFGADHSRDRLFPRGIARLLLIVHSRVSSLNMETFDLFARPRRISAVSRLGPSLT